MDTTLNHIKVLIDTNTYLSDSRRSRYQSVFKRQNEFIQEWKKHQLRAVYQEAAEDWLLEQLDETSVGKLTKNYRIVLYEKSLSNNSCHLT